MKKILVYTSCSKGVLAESFMTLCYLPTVTNHVKQLRSNHLKSKSFSTSERAVDDLNPPSDLVWRGVGVGKQASHLGTNEKGGQFTFGRLSLPSILWEEDWNRKSTESKQISSI